MRKVACIVVMMSVLALGAGAWEREGSGVDKSLFADDYEAWSRWSGERRDSYVWGMISGVAVMGAKVMSMYEGVDEDIGDLVLRYAVRDYVASVSYIYQEVNFRSVPIWAIVFDVDYWLDERNEYE